MSKFSVPTAFLCVILIWSTTPLAVQWSTGNAPITSAFFRMLIGVIFCGGLMAISKAPLPLDRLALRLYLVSGLSIFAGMSLIYWAAQSIPSGWIAVLFGLSPLFTGLFSVFVEPETRLTFSRGLGIMLGLFGLFLVFKAGLSINANTFKGVLLMFISVIVASSSSVLIRHLAASRKLTGRQITTGGLLVAIPIFAVAALIVDPIGAVDFSNKALISIVYLGLIGTGVGFTLYYFLLNNTSANNVSLVTLVTPITALLLGSWLNNEAVIPNVWLGGICVVIGLLLYQYKPRLGLKKL